MSDIVIRNKALVNLFTAMTTGHRIDSGVMLKAFSDASCAPGRDSMGFDVDVFEWLVGQITENVIYLREQDLTYFRVEDWIEPKNIKYCEGEGEIPFLYEVTLKEPEGGGSGYSGGNAPHTTENMHVSLALTALIEFLYRTTRSGLGIDSKKNPVQGGILFDLRDARRFRYNQRRIGKVLWIERAEVGRRTSAGGVKYGGPSMPPFL